jgi:hypothetical protein
VFVLAIGREFGARFSGRKDAFGFSPFDLKSRIVPAKISVISLGERIMTRVPCKCRMLGEAGIVFLCSLLLGFVNLSAAVSGISRSDLLDMLKVQENEIIKARFEYKVLIQYHGSLEDVKREELEKVKEEKRVFQSLPEISEEQRRRRFQQLDRQVEHIDEWVAAQFALKQFSGIETYYFNRDMNAFRIDRKDTRDAESVIPQNNMFKSFFKANLKNQVNIYDGQRVSTLDVDHNAVHTSKVTQGLSPFVWRNTGRLDPKDVENAQSYESQLVHNQEGDFLMVELRSGPAKVNILLDTAKGYVVKRVESRVADRQVQTIDMGDYEKVNTIWIPGRIKAQNFGDDGQLLSTESYELVSAIMNQNLDDRETYKPPINNDTTIMDMDLKKGYKVPYSEIEKEIKEPAQLNVPKGELSQAEQPDVNKIAAAAQQELQIKKVARDVQSSQAAESPAPRERGFPKAYLIIALILFIGVAVLLYRVSRAGGGK